MDLEVALIDLLDLLEFTFSDQFIEKYKGLYTTKFLRHFQIKLHEVMDNKRPIKIKTLYSYLTNRCKYSPEQVLHFFKTIDISLYSPIVFGILPSEILDLA